MRVYASLHPHWPQPRCPAVDQSEPRRRKRDRETFGDDLFVPKQFGRGPDLGAVCLSPVAMVRRCARLSVGVVTQLDTYTAGWRELQSPANHK
jgi:hypothetical protein